MSIRVDPFNLHVRRAFAKVGIAEPKPQQVDAVRDFALRQLDVFVQLPTGFGKSACFHVLPPLFDMMRGKTSPFHIVLVICPLLSIIENQTAHLNSLGVAALDLTAVETGQWIAKVQASQVIFSTPETLLTPTGVKAEARELLLCPNIKKRIVGLVLDEVHCLIKWGDEFRPEYGRVPTLHNLLSCQVMSLTATATLDIIREIQATFSVKGQCTVIREDPSRPNITLKVLPWDQVCPSMLQLYKDFAVHKEALPRTVVFFHSFNLMGEALDMIQEVLRRHPTLVPHFALYHSLLTREQLKSILRLMEQDNGAGNIRLLFASSAFGMGVHVPAISRVWHVEPPAELDDYVQQIGRAARERGAVAEAVLFKRHHPKLHQSMKTYLKNNTQCRHLTIKEHFDFPAAAGVVLAGQCCDLCQME